MQARQLTQQELQSLLAGEDLGGFLLLYDLYSATIYALLLEILAAESTAQAVLCIAFVKMFRERTDYNPKLSAPFAWMLRIALTTAMEHVNDKQAAKEKLKMLLYKQPQSRL